MKGTAEKGTTTTLIKEEGSPIKQQTARVCVCVCMYVAVGLCSVTLKYYDGK